MMACEEEIMTRVTLPQTEEVHISIHKMIFDTSIA